MEDTVSTFIAPMDSLNRDAESLSLDFKYRGIPLHICCRLLSRGITEWKESKDFDHPAPPFSRLFLFLEGQAEVKNGIQVQVLLPGRIYLLPADLPFTVHYSIGKLLFFHLHVYDFPGLSIFKSPTGVMELYNPILFRQILHSYESDDSWQLLSMLMKTVKEFISPNIDLLALSAQKFREFSRLFSWLKDQPLAGVTLGQAADLYGISPGAFSKRFQRTMGLSFKAYLTNQEIQEAQHQLLYTDRNITEIAYALGYEYPPYFYRSFKKHCACTPREYRLGNREI